MSVALSDWSLLPVALSFDDDDRSHVRACALQWAPENEADRARLQWCADCEAFKAPRCVDARPSLSLSLSLSRSLLC